MGIRLRRSAAHFTQYLIVRAVVFVEIVFGSMAIRTDKIIGDITNRATFDRFNVIVITPLDIFNKVFVKPNLTVNDQRRFIDLKLLILRRTGIIMDPLPKRNKFTDKVKKKENNL